LESFESDLGSIGELPIDLQRGVVLAGIPARHPHLERADIFPSVAKLEVAPKGIGVRGKSGEQLHRNETAKYQPESACTTSLHRRSLPVSKVLWFDLFDIMAKDCIAARRLTLIALHRANPSLGSGNASRNPPLWGLCRQDPRILHLGVIDEGRTEIGSPSSQEESAELHNAVEQFGNERCPGCGQFCS
jgi:hypothetical protein